VSTLQCPATLVLATPGTDLPPGLRVAAVWTPEEEPDLLADDVPTLREALSEIADRTPGETTLVPVLDDRLRAALPRLARIEVEPDVLAAAPALALEVDADDWVIRTLLQA
jgi:hypothetical protein